MKFLAKAQDIRQIKNVLLLWKEGWAGGLETCPLGFPSAPVRVLHGTPRTPKRQFANA